MRHWEVGGPINIGWPDFGIPERPYAIVEFQAEGPVFRARVTDGEKQGGFLVVYDCPDAALEMLAEEATRTSGHKVIVSSLRCSIDGVTLRSFDYEWYPTPEYAHRPATITRAIAAALRAMRGEGPD